VLQGIPSIRVFNTLTRRKEEFQPWEPGVVKMYVCGPTVYDETHLGHIRTYVAFDAIKRYLEFRGNTVLHVQNITDIDDKIINRAREEGRSWKEIADTYTKSYLEVIKQLGITPLISPRVTEHINDIIEFINKLVEKGAAYASNGSVYFDVTSYPWYGELSGRLSRESWRQEEEVLKEKKNPFDFALWKKAKPGEPFWESPWGPGRPGWHIECSAMATRYLGDKIDIHGGGQDLIFPHHENERAQSEKALDTRPWVKYWLHTGMLTIKGEKMSKSLGNIITAKELLAKHKPGVIRTWVLSAHYRSQLEFREELMEQAEAVHRKIIMALEDIKRLLKEGHQDFRMGEDEINAVRKIVEIRMDFHRALSDDFNTSAALSKVLEAVSIYNKHAFSKSPLPIAVCVNSFLSEADKVFGFTVGEEKAPAVSDTGIVKSLVELLIEVRRKLREEKRYDLADYIRSSLENLGIILMDKGLETKYYFKKE